MRASYSLGSRKIIHFFSSKRLVFRICTPSVSLENIALHVDQFLSLDCLNFINSTETIRFFLIINLLSRTTSPISLPSISQTSALVVIRGRFFVIGGSTPYIYEFDEAKGWVLFQTMQGLPSGEYSGIVAVPYNL